MGRVKASGKVPVLQTLRVSIEDDYADLTIVASIVARERKGS